MIWPPLIGPGSLLESDDRPAWWTPPGAPHRLEAVIGTDNGDGRTQRAFRRLRELVARHSAQCRVGEERDSAAARSVELSRIRKERRRSGVGTRGGDLYRRKRSGRWRGVGVPRLGLKVYLRVRVPRYEISADDNGSKVCKRQQQPRQGTFHVKFPQLG